MSDYSFLLSQNMFNYTIQYIKRAVIDSYYPSVQEAFLWWGGIHSAIEEQTWYVPSRQEKPWKSRTVFNKIVQLYFTYACLM
jgi:hypothetical protein